MLPGASLFSDGYSVYLGSNSGEKSQPILNIDQSQVFLSLDLTESGLSYSINSSKVYGISTSDTSPTGLNIYNGYKSDASGLFSILNGGGFNYAGVSGNFDFFNTGIEITNPNVNIGAFSNSGFEILSSFTDSYDDRGFRGIINSFYVSGSGNSSYYSGIGGSLVVNGFAISGLDNSVQAIDFVAKLKVQNSGFAFSSLSNTAGPINFLIDSTYMNSDYFKYSVPRDVNFGISLAISGLNQTVDTSFSISNNIRKSYESGLLASARASGVTSTAEASFSQFYWYLFGYYNSLGELGEVPQRNMYLGIYEYLFDKSLNTNLNGKIYVDFGKGFLTSGFGYDGVTNIPSGTSIVFYISGVSGNNISSNSLDPSYSVSGFQDYTDSISGSLSLYAPSFYESVYTQSVRQSDGVTVNTSSISINDIFDSGSVQYASSNLIYRNIKVKSNLKDTDLVKFPEYFPITVDFSKKIGTSGLFGFTGLFSVGAYAFTHPQSGSLNMSQKIGGHEYIFNVWAWDTGSISGYGVNYWKK